MLSNFSDSSRGNGTVKFNYFTKGSLKNGGKNYGFTYINSVTPTYPPLAVA